MAGNVMAIVAHPDDVEFVMAGTLLHLADRGWKIHYVNIANGCYGSAELSPAQCAAVRLKESEAAAAVAGATFYPPLCDDLGIEYRSDLLAKLTAYVRQANPQIVLTHSPIDYMVDHEQACRLAVSACFVRGMPNVPSHPYCKHLEGPVAIYHAQPHGNRDPLGNLVIPHFSVDIATQFEKKSAMLQCHASQQAWLDTTQKMSSYVQAMLDLGEQVGKMSGKQSIAEGWRKHWHLGFAPADFDPLRAELSDLIVEFP